MIFELSSLVQTLFTISMRAPWVHLLAFVVDRIWKSYIISLCSRASARQALSTSKERVMAGGLRAREESDERDDKNSETNTSSHISAAVRGQLK